MTQEHPITPPPPHLLKKFSNQAREESSKRNGAGYLKTFARLCIEWVNSKPTSSLSQIRSSEIQLPTELLAEWLRQACECSPHDHSPGAIGSFMAYKAAQWGADEELAALLVWLRVKGFDNLASDLLAARRPQPPSLKEQALDQLRRVNAILQFTGGETSVIRRALEAIDD